MEQRHLVLRWGDSESCDGGCTYIREVGSSLVSPPPPPYHVSPCNLHGLSLVHLHKDTPKISGLDVERGGRVLRERGEYAYILCGISK